MVKVGGLEFIVKEESISHVIDVVPEGERWYKIQTINEYYSQFLLPAHKNPNWSQGFPFKRIARRVTYHPKICHLRGKIRHGVSLSYEIPPTCNRLLYISYLFLGLTYYLLHLSIGLQ